MKITALDGTDDEVVADIDEDIHDNDDGSHINMDGASLWLK